MLGINSNILIWVKLSLAPDKFSHKKFADETILGGAITIKEAKNLKELLNCYYQVTEQLINWKKSSLFFINTLDDRQKRIATILDCNIENIPSTYLGLPLGLKPPTFFWHSLVDKLNRKLAS